MKYYLIVGEASGDLHASNLMRSLKEQDAEADFRFFGGDLMSAVGGTRVKHYKELAYMGFIPVLLHLRTIFKNMDRCKEDIVQWKPDVVILVDYPGFNLKIAEFVKKHNTVSRTSNEMWMNCSPFFLSRLSFSKDISILFIMWAIHVWMQWMRSEKIIQKPCPNSFQPINWKKSQSLLCWLVVENKK